MSKLSPDIPEDDNASTTPFAIAASCPRAIMNDLALSTGVSCDGGGILLLANDLLGFPLEEMFGKNLG